MPQSHLLRPPNRSPSLHPHAALHLNTSPITLPSQPRMISVTELEAELLNDTNTTPLLSSSLASAASDTLLQKHKRAQRFYWRSQGTLRVSPASAAPNQRILLQWRIPLPADAANDTDADIIALFRARKRIDVPFEEGAIMTREVRGCSRIVADDDAGDAAAAGERWIVGRLQLRTPRGVGDYDFRYFARGAAARLPVCRSGRVAVTVQGAAIFEALGFIRQRLEESDALCGAAVQLAALLAQIHTLRTPLLHAGSDPRRQEEELLRSLLQLIFHCCRLLQAGMREVKVEGDASGVVAAFERLELARREVVAAGEELSTEAFLQWKKARSEKSALERRQAAQEAQRRALHAALRALLDEALTCPPLRPAGDPILARLHASLSLYSPVSNHFFPTIAALKTHCEEELHLRWPITTSQPASPARYTGFLPLRRSFGVPLLLPARVPLLQVGAEKGAARRWVLAVEEEIRRAASPLIPQEGFFRGRLQKLERLEEILNAGVRQDLARWSKANKISLAPFGSSVNSYGSFSSDLDVVLMVLPNSRRMTWRRALVEDIHAEGALSAREIIEDVSEILRRYNVSRIDDARKEARIPILKFRIPLEEEITVKLCADDDDGEEDEGEEEGIECDMCIDNRLALRNTLLLQTYSEVDSRIKYLAQIVKLWARRRDINSPVKHTLPSYGYILLLIFYLQNIATPILPVLQQIPPSVDIQAVTEAVLRGAGDEEVTRLLYSDAELPEVQITGTDGKKHDTYFFCDPCSGDDATRQREMELLRTLAGRNNAGLLELLAGFFEFYGLQLDYRKVVVSVRGMEFVTREDKAAEEGWKISDKMGIEDPFEVNYDVAHVLQPATMATVRKEMVRAYAILTNKWVQVDGEDAAKTVLERLMEEKSSLST